MRHHTQMIDAHFHLWQPSRGDYGWLTPELGTIYRDVTVAHWRDQGRPCGITGGIVVQAAPTEAETAFLLAQAQAEPADDVLGVVGWVDLLAADAPARIARLARHRKLKGLRPMLQDIADPDWILQSALRPALNAMVQHGLVFDALVKPVHLPRIATLARSHPDLRIVIDHGAKPDIAQAQWQGWADAMRELAEETTAFCKLSGLWTEAQAGAPVAAVARHARWLLDCFGPERVLWGSDWPVLELAGRYAAWHAFAIDLVPEADRAQVFEQTARVAYSL
jgi:L-fuconolactonase